MIAMVIRYDLTDEAAATRFDELAAALVAQIAAHEPRTTLYAFHTVDGEPLTRLLYELYPDQEAFQAHQDAGYFKEFLGAREPLLAARRAERLTTGPLAGAGLG